MKILLFITIFLSLAIASNASQSKNNQTKQPNLLFIFPDQFRPHSMGFMHQDPVQTPVIDKLASQGVVFQNAVSNRPLCTPYRGMLMTGKYCFSTNLQTNCNTSSRKYQNFLREDETCISDILNACGYYCGYIGKWHLDAPEGPDVDDWQKAVWEAWTPPGKKRHGFSFWHAYGCNNQHNNPYYWVNDSPRQDTLFARKWSSEHEADVAISFILNERENIRPAQKPWTLFVAMNPPHGPYNEVPEKYKNRYRNISPDSLLNRLNVPAGKAGNIGRNNVVDYFACVSGVDEQIGRILDVLDSSGQAENTIVVFTSDHGEMMGSHGLLQKVVWYDESFRIPLIIRFPSALKHYVSSLHLSVPDMMPTLLSMMNLQDKIPAGVEGENLSELIVKQKSGGPDFSLYLNCSQESALGGMRGLRNDRYTFVIQRNNSGQLEQYLLFDNKKDPFQLENIADQNPGLVHQFEDSIFKKISTINDPWVVYKP